MIHAKHHPVIYPFFKWLTGFLLKRHFNSVRIEPDFQDNGKPILIVSNHMSWWDGFWMMHLNLKMTQRRFHFMMLEEQLKKHWYFAYTGGFSIKKQTRSALESLHYTNTLLQDSDNLVVMFPQGEIQSMHQEVIHFEHGLQRIIDKAADDLQVLFVVNMVDYLSDPKPNLWIYTQGHSAKALKDNTAEHKYNTFYKATLAQQKTKAS